MQRLISSSHKQNFLSEEVEKEKDMDIELQKKIKEIKKTFRRKPQLLQEIQ